MLLNQEIVKQYKSENELYNIEMSKLKQDLSEYKEKLNQI